mmetsp:Transcript_131638/g.262705  ORF Transcript_131638/g.262705 Transcript_131638/m.262705 type:complete len:218 (-) Transcript_131638:423-1076(-)
MSIRISLHHYGFDVCDVQGQHRQWNQESEQCLWHEASPAHLVLVGNDVDGMSKGFLPCERGYQRSTVYANEDCLPHRGYAAIQLRKDGDHNERKDRANNGKCQVFYHGIVPCEELVVHEPLTPKEIAPSDCHDQTHSCDMDCPALCWGCIPHYSTKILDAKHSNDSQAERPEEHEPTVPFFVALWNWRAPHFHHSKAAVCMIVPYQVHVCVIDSSSP